MITLFAAAALLLGQAPTPTDLEPGSLIGSGKNPIVLPLKGTRVNADISGFGARVTVVQTFTNPTKEALEAVYTFPLPADAGVDRMRMQIGNRTIDGVIKRREEARLIYEAAKNRGQAAALLDQERPNIFTQSVANILPGSEVRIEISYVQLLKFEDGQFEFSFPMVVGPRYLGNAPDPGKIAPPLIPKGMRTGSNISLSVSLDAGAPLTAVNSVLHEIAVNGKGAGRALIELRKKDEIPNRDFILRYRVSTDSVQSALLAKYDPVKGGYFSLILMPPQAPAAQQIAPKEMIFVIDQSGSQQGFPIAKSKELTSRLIETMNPGDTFNVLGFNVGVNSLWPEPRPNTPQNRAEAQKFLESLDANGGTELRKAVDAALGVPSDPKRIRLVVFNTDGFVGDEREILQSIREHRGNARMFTFGIGNGVNRYLIDAMSEEGKGDSEIVTLAEKADGAVQRFVQRTQNPILTNLSAKFDGIEVSDELPSQIPDVFGSKPIVIYGRYAAPGAGTLTLSGTMAGKPWSQAIEITFPSDRPGGESIPTLWARKMVDKLEREYALGTRKATMAAEGQNAVTDLALEYGIMTQYTSFVAVEQRVINVGGKQRTVHVPVEMADGVSYEGVGADKLRLSYGKAAASPMVITKSAGGGGVTGGITTGTMRGGFAQDSSGFVAAPTKEKREEIAYQTKVAKPLRTAKGIVEVQIWLSNLDPKTLTSLKSLGLKLDQTDKNLKAVFGRMDAKLLKKLAQLEAVQRVEPLT